MVGPGFPRRGRQALRMRQKLLFGKIFYENCMKMKEIGQKVGERLTPDPPMIFLYFNRLFPGSHEDFKCRSSSARYSILYIIFRNIFGSPLASHPRVYFYFCF